MKNVRKTIAMLLTMVLVLGIQVDVMAAGTADEGYKVTFVSDHATIDVYYTQDYTSPDEMNVEAAYARSSSTGEIDTSGSGQVNFKVTADEGYTIKSVSADANYKNLKGQEDTGVENLYRLTKITGEVTVTVTTVDSAMTENSIKINEVNSSPDDWVEIINIGNETVDLSGYEMKDNSDDHSWKFTDGTTIEAGEILLVDAHKAGLIYNDTTSEFVPGEFQDAFGLGSGDSVRLYDNTGSLLDSYLWTEHASYEGDAAKASYGRYPDGTGSFVLMPETPGEPNGEPLTEDTSGDDDSITDRLNAIDWPGADYVTVSDFVFLEDSSGLDFANGKLYAIDNGTATLWVIDVAKDGTMSFAKGYENGKQIRYQKDADNASAAGPDTEGVTVDGNGYVYAASERDNGEKGVNYNSLLMVDPNAEGSCLVAMQEWDLTDLLPAVSANMGIEAVEWVSNANVQGVLYDENTQAGFDASNYPNAISGGIFFVALEDNGHAYAFVLNDDGTATMIADIDSGIGGAMALDFDTYENVLWIAADNGYGNISAKVSLNGTSKPDITYVAPAKELDSTANNEGFAIADAEYTVDGLRPVYHFTDGVKKGALSITYLNCDYKGNPDSSDEKDDPNTGGTVDDGKGDAGNGNISNGVNKNDTGSDTGKNGTTGGSGKNLTGAVKTPKTGDNFNFVLWGVLMTLGLSGIAGSVIVGKKSKK